ncbi:MAG: hypothetical protein Q9210_001040, partial [Variospora velana]
MNSDAHLYDETTDSDEEYPSNEYNPVTSRITSLSCSDHTASTPSQANELFVHLADKLARARKRGPPRAAITGDTPNLETIIASDKNHFRGSRPPYVRTRKSWKKPRSAFLCDEAEKATDQEITIEPREYQKDYIYLIAVVQGREHLLNPGSGGSGGGCFYRVWLGHRHGEDQTIFARSRVTPKHHRQNALDNERIESSTSEYFGHHDGSNETPEMATANRSVSNEQTTMDKRSDSACDRCRTKKAKCSRDLPHCGRCLSVRAECSYPLRQTYKRSIIIPTPKDPKRKSDILTSTVRKTKRVRTSLDEDPSSIPASEPQTTLQATNRPQNARRDSDTTAVENSVRRRGPAPPGPNNQSFTTAQVNQRGPLLGPEASQPSTPVPKSSIRPSTEYYLERSIQLKMDRLDRIAEKRQLTEAELGEQDLLA